MILLLLHELILLLAHSELGGVVCSVGWELILSIELLSKLVTLSLCVLARHLHLSQAARAINGRVLLQSILTRRL